MLPYILAIAIAVYSLILFSQAFFPQLFIVKMIFCGVASVYFML